LEEEGTSTMASNVFTCEVHTPTRTDRANWGDKSVEGLVVDPAEGAIVNDGVPPPEKSAYDREGELIRSIFPEYLPGMMSSGDS
jgi:hypothetical protein